VRVLDVSPRVAFPPRRGSAVRIFNLLSYLSERHEVRQFSYARVRGHEGVESRVETIWHTPSYCEITHRHPLP
jgi:hypothetical protein